MNSRDELADEMFGWTVSSGYYGQSLGSEVAQEIADHLIATGYRKPRAVTTAEELDALPVGTVLLDRRLDICYRLYVDLAYKSPVWCVVGETEPSSPRGWLPMTVLYEPEADQ